MSEELTVRNAIDFAIATEEMGVRAYSKLAKSFSEQAEIAGAFSLLARDEKAHRAQFETLLENAPPDEGAMIDDDSSGYLRAMVMSEFFTGDDGLIGKIDKTDSLDQVLIHVLQFEKATLGYYLAFKDVLGESEVLDSIIQAEKGHIVRLMKYIITDEKMKGLADIF